MDKAQVSRILDVETYTLLVRALGTGDPEEYHAAKPSTHPYFDPDIESIHFIELEELEHFLQEEIGRQALQLNELRKQVPWRKSAWSLEEAKLNQTVERFQIQLDRLWHLEIDLKSMIQKRLLDFGETCAENLDLTSSDVDTLALAYGKDLLTSLAAGWKEQSAGEA